MKKQRNKEDEATMIQKLFDRYKEPGALYYPVDETHVRNITPASGTRFQLEEMQAYVKGFIEIITLEREGLPAKLLIVNDQGGTNYMAVNLLATGVFTQFYGRQKADILGPIFGPAIICDPAFIK